LGLGLSAFFWLPAIREMGYTSVSGQVSETANFMDHFVCIGQLWSSLWGYGGSVAGCVDGMSFMLGKWHLIIAFFGIIGWFIVRPKEGKTVFAVGLAIALLGTFFVTSYSRVVWQILPGFGYVQYPWRFLALSGFGLSLVGGLVVLYIPNGWWRTGIALIVAVWILGMNAKWFTPQYTYSKMSSDFENSQDIKWRVSKISDEYLPFDIVRPKDASQVVFDTIREADGLTVSKHKDTAIWEQIVVEATRSSDVVINKAYFPGWRYYVNNREVSPHIVQGLPRVSISEGRSVIDIKFTDTPVRTIANLISLGSLMIVGVTWYEKQRKPNR